MVLNLMVIVAGYLLGSIPSAYIVTKLSKDIDIREVGTGNMGAANIFREIGVWQGIVVCLIDMTKGAVTILIAWALGVSQPWLLGAGFAALLGHNFPVYLGFRGGIGSATAMGIFLVLAPIEMCIALGIMAIPLLIMRNAHKVAIVIGIGIVFVPLLIWLFQTSVILTCYSSAIIAFIGLRSLPAPHELLGRIKKR